MSDCGAHTSGDLVTPPGGPTFSITKQKSTHCLVHACLHLIWACMPKISISFEDLIGFLRDAEEHFAFIEQSLTPGRSPEIQGTNFKIQHGVAVFKMLLEAHGYTSERHGMRCLDRVDDLIVSELFSGVVLKDGHYVAVVNKRGTYYVLNSCSPHVTPITIPDLCHFVDAHCFIVVKKSL